MIKIFENITLHCCKCGEPVSLSVNREDIESWIGGKLIQDAMPYLTTDEREMLKTKICGKCWEKMFDNG